MKECDFELVEWTICADEVINLLLSNVLTDLLLGVG